MKDKVPSHTSACTPPSSTVRRHGKGRHKTERLNVLVLVASTLLCAGKAFPEDLSPDQRATATWMIERSKAWADQACGGKWVISDLFAADFKGTSPKGSRYEKPAGEPPNDPNTKWSTNCTLDDADVRFLGPMWPLFTVLSPRPFRYQTESTSAAASFGPTRGSAEMEDGRSSLFKTIVLSVLQSEAAPDKSLERTREG